MIGQYMSMYNITPYMQWNKIGHNQGFGHNICSKQSMPQIGWSPPNTSWRNQQRGPKVCPSASNFKFLLCRVVHLPWGRSAQMCRWQKSSEAVRRTMKGQFWDWPQIHVWKWVLQRYRCLNSPDRLHECDARFTQSLKVSFWCPKPRKGREWKV